MTDRIFNDITDRALNGMTDRAFDIIDKLAETHALSRGEWTYIIESRSPELFEYLSEKAYALRRNYYKNHVYIRGLVEVSSCCRNDCLYCGIRRGNSCAQRYRLSKGEILSCCDEGYSLGFRTFVLQGGEDAAMTAEVVGNTVSSIKSRYPDCAVTLSLGEHSKETYSHWFNCGADRYLLRHETANREHYARLHPPSMSYDNRMRCLRDLKEIGFQTGCGFMTGSPYQTAECLADDMIFLSEFQPDMVGIGPFIPHSDTPFASFPSGTLELTLFMLALTRLTLPTVLLPATTALGTIASGGREAGMRAGANVCMPNLSPLGVRAKYSLYNGKLNSGAESAQSLAKLKNSMRCAGFEIVVSRGDRIAALK